jgi:hypothetical protein
MRTREQAAELNAVAPLVYPREQPELVGPCTLVANAGKTVGVASAELLRTARGPLAIALTLDGKRILKVVSWTLAGSSGLGILTFEEAFPDGGQLDVAPLDVGAVSASVETRGAPAAIVTVEARQAEFSRVVLPVFVDAWTAGGMIDDVVLVASPQDAEHAGKAIDGAVVFAWLPADAVLGRPSEVVAVALALPYRSQLAKPRPIAPIAELVGLSDLGVVLPYEACDAEVSNDLRQVAGEIKGA